VTREVYLRQQGVVRTNCLDCLDRTNLLQSKLAFDVLAGQLALLRLDLLNVLGPRPLESLDVPLKKNHPFVKNFKEVWAYNGDLVSYHYTGTGSTHTDVTLTGKRDKTGMLVHGIKSLQRFYN